MIIRDNGKSYEEIRECLTKGEKPQRMIGVPQSTFDRLKAVQKLIQDKTGIDHMSRRQIIEVLMKDWNENNQPSSE